MKVLLDTAALLLLATDPEAVPWDTRDLLADPETELFYSALAVWEIVEAAARGEVAADAPLDRLFKDFDATYCLRELPLAGSACLHLSKLPPGGSDRDRLLAAQALAEGAALASPRAEMSAFPLRIVW
jgi:PIN domain nuclease of toxin-antitoxin system